MLRARLALAVAVALLTGLVAAPPAMAHSETIYPSATTGMAGGSGSVTTQAMVNVSSSHASSQVEQVAIWNDTNRTVAYRARLFVSGLVVADRSGSVSPGGVSIPFISNTWWSKDSNPYLRIDMSASGGAARHYLVCEYGGSGSGSTWPT